MGKKTFLGIIDKTIAGRRHERPQEMNSSIGEGVSMAAKEVSNDVDNHTGSELPVRCLSGDCEYVSYKDVNGVTALWCSKENKTVLNTERCPLDRWYKDENGWPHKK